MPPLQDCEFHPKGKSVQRRKSGIETNVAATLEDTRCDQSSLQLYTVTVRDFFLPEVYFASRSTERDCHLVVPPPAVPRFFLNCTSLDHWFPNRCLRISDAKGTIGKNIFQVLTQLKKQACNSQSSVPTQRNLSPENLSGI